MIFSNGWKVICCLPNFQGSIPMKVWLIDTKAMDVVQPKRGHFNAKNTFLCFLDTFLPEKSNVWVFIEEKKVWLLAWPTENFLWKNWTKYQRKPYLDFKKDLNPLCYVSPCHPPTGKRPFSHLLDLKSQ